MDLNKIIDELREELEMLNQVVESLEALHAMRRERHGLPALEVRQASKPMARARRTPTGVEAAPE